MNQKRSQREVEVGPASDVDVLDRPGDVERASGVHVEAQRMQQPAEMQEVGEEIGHTVIYDLRFGDLRFGVRTADRSKNSRRGGACSALAPQRGCREGLRPKP